MTYLTAVGENTHGVLHSGLLSNSERFDLTFKKIKLLKILDYFYQDCDNANTSTAPNVVLKDLNEY